MDCFIAQKISYNNGHSPVPDEEKIHESPRKSGTPMKNKWKCWTSSRKVQQTNISPTLHGWNSWAQLPTSAVHQIPSDSSIWFYLLANKPILDMNVEPSFRLQPCLIQIYISKTTFYLLANKPSLDMNVEPSFRLPSNVSYRRQLSLSPKYSLKIVAVGGTFELTSARAGPKIVSTCKREGPEIVLIRTAHQTYTST